MTKYFITGSSGFLGKHLRERLSGKTYLFNRGQNPRVLLKFKPDVILHLAGEIYEENQMVDSNILLTHELLEQARQLPTLQSFIHIGSSSEYGRKDHPMTETDFLDPTTMYEATKGSATLLCQAYARSYGVPVTVARPFSVYGKHEPSHRFIPTIIRKISKRKELSIAPGAHDFIHVDDFIDGLLLLAANPKPGEIFNFGTGVQTSNEGLVKVIETILKKKTRKKLIPKLHDYDSDSWVADSTKSQLLGWKPKYSLLDGLIQVIREMKEKAVF